MGSNKNTLFTVDGSPESKAFARALADLQRSATLPGDEFDETDLSMEEYERIVHAGLQALYRHFETVTFFDIEDLGESLNNPNPDPISPDSFEVSRWLLHFDASGLRDAPESPLSCRVTFEPNSTQADDSSSRNIIYVSSSHPSGPLYYDGFLNRFDPMDVAQREVFEEVARLSSEYDLGITEVVDYLAVTNEFGEEFGENPLRVWSSHRDRHYETIRGNVRNVEDHIETRTAVSDREVDVEERDSGLTQDDLDRVSEALAGLMDEVEQSEEEEGAGLMMNVLDERVRVTVHVDEDKFLHCFVGVSDEYLRARGSKNPVAAESLREVSPPLADELAEAISEGYGVPVQPHFLATKQAPPELEQEQGPMALTFMLVPPNAPRE